MFGSTRIKAGKMTLEVRKDFPLASKYPETVPLNALDLRDKKNLLKACEKLAEVLDDAISKDEEEAHADKHFRCKICGAKTKRLKTTAGDPEGIRHDRQCTNRKCKRLHGMTKAHFFAYHENKRIAP